MNDRLRKVFIKAYKGKRVPPKWNKTYGKEYQTDEAEEIFYKWARKKGYIIKE